METGLHNHGMADGIMAALYPKRGVGICKGDAFDTSHDFFQIVFFNSNEI